MTAKITKAYFHIHSVKAAKAGGGGHLSVTASSHITAGLKEEL